MKLIIAAPFVFCAALASGAELPTRLGAGAPAEKARTCHVGGRDGVLLPGSDICVALSGSASGAATVGNASTQYRQRSP